MRLGVHEDVILGLDIGVGSIGWALIAEDRETLEKRVLSRRVGDMELPALGVRAFNVPEDHKTKELLNAERRAKRLQRRVIARRAKRLSRTRILLAAQGLPAYDQAALSCLSPWNLRNEGLHRLLAPLEWSCVLVHMAKHRGFKSNSKRDKAAADAESRKVLAAVGSLQAAVREAQTTVGAYMAQQCGAVGSPLRNRKNSLGEPSYAATVLRDLVIEEGQMLFARQRMLGNPVASEALWEQYRDVAFTQKPLPSMANLIGVCLFYPDEKRAPRFSPTAERFRMAQRLVNMRLGDEERPLTPVQVEKALATLGAVKSFTYTALRKLLGLHSQVRFANLSYGGKDKNGKEVNPESVDIVSKAMGAGGIASYTLCKVLGQDAYKRLGALRVMAGVTEQSCLDSIAKIISENDDIELIASFLQKLPLSADESHTLMTGVREGHFVAFRGTMRLSLKAMEAILPHMIATGSYDLGCQHAGLDHTKTPELDMRNIANPVVARVFREAGQQCKAIMQAFGCIPGRVHVELLRDVGKSKEERNLITRGLQRRSSEKDAVRAKLAELWNVSKDSISGTEVLRYELWKAQGGKCAYYMLWEKHGGERCYAGSTAHGAIPVEWLRDASGSGVQIDHILPYSRTFDDSFHNKCLCIASANQAKGNRTPWEWLGQHAPDAWHRHEEWVKSLYIKGLKKRNFCIKNLDADMEGRFHARNLSDSAYVARLMQQWWANFYAEQQVPMHHEDGKGKRRVFARPGGITAKLRHEWGVERLKKSEEGSREGDKHHALDALVIACCSEGLLQKLTRIMQQREVNLERARIPEPWMGFAGDACTLLKTVFVSRAERGRTKGALHEETLRGIRKEIVDGEEVEKLYIRKNVHGLTPQDMKKIAFPERYPKTVWAGLERWAALDKTARKNSGNLPKDAQGNTIRRVRLCEGLFLSGVRVPRGESFAQASNDSIVRTDVFTRNGKFYLVPVYTWHVAQKILPNKAIVAGKPEKDWLEMEPSLGFGFCFALIPNSYVFTEKKGVVKEGYFVGVNRATGAIALAMPHDRQIKMDGIGVQQLHVFEKYRVDRLGDLSRVRKETRLGPDGHNPVEE